MAIYSLGGLEKHIPRVELSYTAYFVLVYSLCLLPAAVIVLLSISGRPEPGQPRGCRRIGLRIRSNLADEHDEHYESGTSQEEGDKRGDRWRVKSLWIYPVKSCRGVELNVGNVMSSGMEYDRLFSFAQLKNSSVNASKEEKRALEWEFVSQRTHNLLAKVKTEIWIPDPSSPTYSPEYEEVQSGGVIVVTYPDKRAEAGGILQWFAVMRLGDELERSFMIPLHPTAEQRKRNGYTMEKMTIWKDCPMALNMTSSVPPGLESFLKDSLNARYPLGLFRVAPDHHREVFRCAPRKEQLGYQPVVGFVDAYPLHILNVASVHDVARKLDGKGLRLSCLQFRANIIVTGPQAYDEDAWKRIRIGDFDYHVVCRTARCKLPNTDQITGEKHPSEPDETLRSFRCIDAGAGKNACLGMMMVPSKEESKIKVGDIIEVVDVGEHYYIKQ